MLALLLQWYVHAMKRRVGNKGGREGGREGGRVGEGRERGREGGRRRGREGGWGREGGREGGRREGEGGRDGGRERDRERREGGEGRKGGGGGRDPNSLIDQFHRATNSTERQGLQIPAGLPKPDILVIKLRLAIALKLEAPSDVTEKVMERQSPFLDLQFRGMLNAAVICVRVRYIIGRRGNLDSSHG